MPSYLHPGVYIEEIPSGSKPIEAVGTSTAAFVGYADEGPFKEPTFITSWEDYENNFGGFRERKKPGDPDDLMGRAVYAFFQNGGGKAYIVRVADDAAAAASGGLTDSAPPLTVEAFSPGLWGNGLQVKITARESSVSDVSDALFDVEVGREDDEGTFVAQESYDALSLDKDSDQFFAELLPEKSERVGKVTIASAGDAVTAINAASGSSITIELSDGDNGDIADKGKYDDVFSQFLKYRDINIILLPDKNWNDDKETIQSAISHCETMKNRMVIPDLNPTQELEKAKDITDMNLATSTYAAIYYPWPKTRNPFFDAEKNPNVPRLLPVPASAYAAGQWAKTDGNRGVWKAPAGVANGLLGLNKLSYTVEDAEQDYLNPLGINAFRQLPNYGAVVWGSRTLATKADPEWRYIPVRRTAMFIEESIFNGIHWAVFEPNDHRLWSALRLNIESFMSGLHRSGAFQGEKSSDAYFVRCGLGQTMTQGDIDRGQVIVQVGFAPLKPAEFVIVRIQQKVGQQ